MAGEGPPSAPDPTTTKAKPAKGKKPGNQKPANYPKYSDMLRSALTSLKERGGSSRQAILKYILANFCVSKDEKTVNNHLKLALQAGVEKGVLKQAKGTGATGSFKLNTALKSEDKPKAKPSKVKKPKTPAKATAKKTSPTKKAASKKPRAAKAKTASKKTTKKGKHLLRRQRRARFLQRKASLQRNHRSR